jgi:hypothetical protein
VTKNEIKSNFAPIENFTLDQNYDFFDQNFLVAKVTFSKISNFISFLVEINHNFITRLFEQFLVTLERHWILLSHPTFDFLDTTKKFI